MNDMLTGECSVCNMHFNLLHDGTIRLHNNNRGVFCGGSGRKPAEPKQFFGWLGGS